MNEALRLLGECAKRADGLAEELKHAETQLVTVKGTAKSLERDRDAWKDDAEGQAKSNASSGKRIGELERDTEELQEQLSDICRIRKMLLDAGIEGPDTIAAGTELSSKLGVLLKRRGALEDDLGVLQEVPARGW